MRPIAVLPAMYTIEDVAKNRTKKVLITLLCVVALISVLLLVHWLYVPLDVLFYKVLRQL